MHLLWNDAAPLPAPEPIGMDDAGAQRLAEIYAPPSDRDHVRAMLNTTLDGTVAGADGTSGSLRNPTDSFAFGVLRALTDAVLVGAATVRAEDYRRPLGRASLREPSRRPSGAGCPALAIFTRTSDLPGSIEADWPTLLVTPPRHGAGAGARAGIPPEQVIEADSPAIAIRSLHRRGLRTIQCEGGPSVLTDLLAAGVVDELCLSISHRTVGGQGPRLAAGADLDQDWRLASLIVGEHATLTRYLRA